MSLQSQTNKTNKQPARNNSDITNISFTTIVDTMYRTVGCGPWGGGVWYRGGRESANTTAVERGESEQCGRRDRERPSD